ncbi:uncharacterized protein TRAVEDRAFT_22783 [Trametes versicolor FP-101664 SS1]|uniref:uncharacterized protein n=1 Tax=Trametes versicolor (strain FP-101664) TaxID=717944 RepID=UPI00046230AE|nr:uncharacterized protein TRAVEDRAFT_22783 [Trametes versicolor FP-101664 SS1]EIW54960.1 hypothetical protein TRAVEDRAFT_22783 [Trametes versicolor FP-101664 SS1]
MDPLAPPYGTHQSQTAAPLSRSATPTNGADPDPSVNETTQTSKEDAMRSLDELMEQERQANELRVQEMANGQDGVDEATPIATPASQQTRRAEAQMASPDPFIVTPARGQRIARPFAPLLGYEMESTQEQSKASTEQEDWLQELTSDAGSSQNTTPTERPRPETVGANRITHRPGQSTHIAATAPPERPLKRLRTEMSPETPSHSARSSLAAVPHTQTNNVDMNQNTAVTAVRAGTSSTDEPLPQYTPPNQEVAVNRSDVFGFLADAVNVWIAQGPMKNGDAPPAPYDGSDIERLIEACASSTQQEAPAHTMALSYSMTSESTQTISNPALPGIYQSDHAARQHTQHAASYPRANFQLVRHDRRAAADIGEYQVTGVDTGEAPESMDVDPNPSRAHQRGSHGTEVAAPQHPAAPGSGTEDSWPPLANFRTSLDRVRFLNTSGIIRVVERMLSSYPERHRRGPFDITNNLSAATLRAWDNERPNQRCLVSFYKGKVLMSEEDVEFYRSIIRAVFKEATGETAFIVYSPKIAPRRDRWDSARFFPVLNCSPHATRILFEQNGWSTPFGSVFIDIELERIPFYMYTLDGFANVLERENLLATQVEGYLRDKDAQAITRALVMHDVNPPNDVNRRVTEILSRIVVSIVDYGARDKQGKRPIVANIHCAPPTEDPVLWEEWRDGLQALGAPTSFGIGKVRKHMRCDTCHGADHPTHICPYDKLGWYDTPNPPRAKRGAPRVQSQTAPPQGNRTQPGRQGWAGEDGGQGGLAPHVAQHLPSHAQQPPQVQQTLRPPYSGAPLYGNLPPRYGAQPTNDVEARGSTRHSGGAPVYGTNHVGGYGGAPRGESTHNYNAAHDFTAPTTSGNAHSFNAPQTYGGVPAPMAAPVNAHARTSQPAYGGAYPHGTSLPFNDPQAYGRVDVPQHLGGAHQPNQHQPQRNASYENQGRPTHAPRYEQASRASQSVPPAQPFMPCTLNGEQRRNNNG